MIALYPFSVNKVRQRIQFYHPRKRGTDREVPLEPGVRRSRLQAAFDMPFEPHREVLTLSRIVGLSNAEIA